MGIPYGNHVSIFVNEQLGDRSRDSAIFVVEWAIEGIAYIDGQGTSYIISITLIIDGRMDSFIEVHLRSTWHRQVSVFLALLHLPFGTNPELWRAS